MASAVGAIVKSWRNFGFALAALVAINLFPARQPWAGVPLVGRFRMRQLRAGLGVCFARGKYRQRALTEVAQRDPGYLRWLLPQTLLSDAHRLIADALLPSCLP